MSRIVFLLTISLILLLADLYVYQGLKVLISKAAPATKRWVFYTYWGITIISIAGIFAMGTLEQLQTSRMARNIIVLGIFINIVSKLFTTTVLLIGDLYRGIQWLLGFVTQRESNTLQNSRDGIPRSEFLTKSALAIGLLPVVSIGYGIAFGAHDYRIRRVSLALRNLPAGLEGLRIIQLSDIHSGSFYNEKAVLHGVEQVMAEKADLVFFTGDLVNSDSKEIKPYFDIFKQVKAPLGVYSTLGNHDYGDYKEWSSPQAKQRNLELMYQAHQELGWNLLRNENQLLKIDGANLSIIGVENWGKGRFAKYGDLDQAYQNSADADLRLLLSHDPSHWDAQVRTDHPDIEATFSGHTHGFQFGVETPFFRWSPAQYAYKQWAGLYQKGGQQLYVNRGFGFIGFPGRVGMPPEITVFALKSA